MTAQPADAAPVEEPRPVAAVPDPPIRINSNPDAGGLCPFELAYLGPDGEERVETFHIRLKPPFAIYRRWEELRVATERNIPAIANEAAIRFFRVGMPIDDANRLVRLIEGDEKDVGAVTGDAIGDIVELLRANAYDAPKPVPPSPGSSNGRRSTGRSSSAKKSSPASKSTASRRSKR